MILSVGGGLIFSAFADVYPGIAEASTLPRMRGVLDPTGNFDLYNFVTSVVIEDSDGVVTPPKPLVDGDKYKITVNFAEIIGVAQFEYDSGCLRYELPENIKLLQDIVTEPIKLNNGNTVGWYSATMSDGLFEVRFGNYDQLGNSGSDNFIDHADAKFMLKMDTTFVAGSDPDRVSLDFGSAWTLAFDVDPPEAGIKVDKTAATAVAGNKINYTTTITASGDNVTNISLTDKPYFSTSSPAQTPITPAQAAAYDSFEYTINSTPPSITMGDGTGISLWDNATSSFVYDFNDDHVTLTPGDVITVTYTLDVDLLIAKGIIPPAPAYYAGNGVTVTAGENGELEDTDSTQNTINTTTSAIDKSHSSGLSTELIATTWTATVGNGSMKLNSLNISDTMSSDNLAYPMTPPSATDITVRFYTTPGGTTADYSITANLLTSNGFAMNSTGFTFVVPVAGSSVPIGVVPNSVTEFGDIHKIEFVYSTAAPDLPANTTVIHTNKIEVGGWTLSDTADRTYTKGRIIGSDEPEGVTIVKTSSHPRENADNTSYEIEYKVEVTVPAGNDGNFFHLQDELTLYDRTTGYDSYSIPMASIIPLVTFVDESGVALNPQPRYKLTKNANNWTMYFESHSNPDYAATSAADSEWVLSAKTKIIITYTLPLYLTPGTAANNPGGLTIEALLKQIQYSYVLNNMILKSSTEATISSTATRDGWPIHKNGTASSTDPSLFNYTVTLNGSYTSNYNARYQLFISGDKAIFIDTFDPALEYVPGSFYVTSSSNSNGVEYKLSDDSNISSNGTLTVDLSTISPTIAGLYGSSTITIHYQLKVVKLSGDDDKVEATTLKFDNTATIESTTLSSDFSNKASVEFTIPKPIAKEMPFDGKLGTVTIVINPYGQKLAPDGQDYFNATDTMSDNLEFYYNSIKVEALENGSWVTKIPENTPASPSSFIPTSPTARWVWQDLGTNNNGEPEIEFIFPDETPIRITYKVLIKAAIGEEIGYFNKIWIYGTELSAEASDASHEVQGSDVTANVSAVPVTLKKVDVGDDSTKLPGATFDLYLASPNNGYYAGGTAPTGLKNMTVNGINFYWIEEKTTGGTGDALFSSLWITPGQPGLYMLVETDAPRGYVLPASPNNQTFFVLGTMNDTDKDAWKTKLGNDVVLEGITDLITVTNNARTVDPGTPTTEPPPTTDPEGGTTQPQTTTGPQTTTAAPWTFPPDETSPTGPTQPSSSDRGDPTNPPGTPQPTSADPIGPTQPPRSSQPSGTPQPPADPPPAPRDPAAPEPSIDPPLPDPQPDPQPEPAPEQQQQPEPEPQQQEQPSDSTYIPGGNNFAIPPNPTVEGHTLEADGDGWIEFDDAGVPLGRWDWIDPPGEWVFTDLDIPLGNMIIPEEIPVVDGTPNTGDPTNLPMLYVLLAMSFIGMVVIATWQIKVKQSRQK